MHHSLKLIPGLGDKRITVLNSVGIHSVEDLIRHVPRRYLDRTKVVPLSEATPEGETTSIVTVKQSRIVPGRMKRLVCTVYDDTAEVEVVFFNAATYMQNKFCEGAELVVSGTLTDQFKKSMIHPDIYSLSPGEEYTGEVVPLYPLTEELKKARVEQKFLKKIIAAAFEIPTIKSLIDFPAPIVRQYQVIDELENLKRLHQPVSMGDVAQGFRQLKLQELLPFTTRLIKRRKELVKHGRSRVVDASASESLKSRLPFILTDSQVGALTKINEGLHAARQYHALVQGDVGSGKTVVAFCAITDVVSAGFQTALMAPTEILAWQHFMAAKELFEPLGQHVEILTGSMATSDRKELLTRLVAGQIDILIGTHVLFSQDVIYRELGLVVIDEQHRFGVEQRAKLLDKGAYPDMLAMSATPIPRSLTMALYGDLTPVVIDQKPAGRKEIMTRVVPGYKRDGMKTFIQNEVAQGGQVYWVVPRIEAQDESPLVSIDVLYKELESFFDAPVAYLHGKTDEEYKRATLDAFNAGDISVLVSTTVIEVGVNVPAATIMVIEGADRFGLAQLHQLRGRVGRGSKASWCFLLSESEERERLDLFAETENGFDIAEMDLADRGAGNLEAYAQSGARAFKYFDFIKDFTMIEDAVQFSEYLFGLFESGDLDKPMLVEEWLKEEVATIRGIA
ncbi:MAG: ATP-dependent DNA helicase RecG [Fibrobacterales bacterium]